MSNKLVSKQLKSAGILVLLFALFPWPVKADGGASLVRWRSFDDSIFAEAKRDNKLVLLDLEAVWCHWCHVMAHESFEDPATAAQMNRDFINIKVDREERPDLDSIYMAAVVAMTGQGGWPMTVALTPDGKPFVKERVELAQSKGTFWQDYKFTNPVSKKIEPKSMYCENLEDAAVCGGIYK